MEQSVLIAVLLGLGAAVGWGVGDFWAAKAAKTIGAITAAFFVNAIGAAAFIVWYLLFLRPDVTVQAPGLAYAITGGVSITLAMLFFYKALAAGPVSVVSPISASYPLVTTLLVLLIFDGKLSLLQLAAILLIMGGVMAAAGLFETAGSKRNASRGPLLALIAAVFYGMSFAFIAQATQRMGWQFTTLVQVIVSLGVFALLLPVLRGKEQVLAHIRQTATNRFVIGSGIFGMAALVAVNIGFGYDQSSGAIITTVSACYPVLTILLALRHFKEEIRPIPLAGAGVTITGVVVLSLS